MSKYKVSTVCTKIKTCKECNLTSFSLQMVLFDSISNELYRKYGLQVQQRSLGLEPETTRALRHLKNTSNNEYINMGNILCLKVPELN